MSRFSLSLKVVVITVLTLSGSFAAAQAKEPVPENTKVEAAAMPPIPPVKPQFSNAFSFDSLKQEAAALAQQPYSAPDTITSQWLKNLSYDSYRDLRFNHDKAIWSEDGLPFHMEFFHLGAIFTTPVQIYEVDAEENAHRFAYNPDLFVFGKDGVVPHDHISDVSDYAGFRLHYPLNRPDYYDEFLVFLGASYFRGVAKGQNYGLSARGLAVNTAMPQGEEFPMFRKFWIVKPAEHARHIKIYALLDSPSVTGAYVFDVTPGRITRMDVSSTLYPRQDIDRLGIAPLTSMFEFGENDNRLKSDFRPEVHDSDGLLLNNSTGEWVWRPLLNPVNLGVSSFALENPRGFGLMQRDRNFSDYEDLEARYESRPSLWVEPQGKWGKGTVQLVEIPTDSEIHDNIVAYWIPDQPVKAGQPLSFDYTLNWGDDPDSSDHPAMVLSTRVGRQFDQNKIKFVIDFEGLSGRYRKEDGSPDVDLWTSKGKIEGTSIAPNPHSDGWRVSFDLNPYGQDTHEMRCILKRNGQPVSETWSYQWRPE